MKLKWITAAALAMGVSSAIPSVASADNWRDRYDSRYERLDHDDWRHERVRDFDRDISLRDVPGRVMDTIDHERRGRAIEEVQFVHRDGKFFYRFRIDDPGRHDRDLSIRVAEDGGLLSVEEAARYDRGYVYRHHR